MARQRNKQRRTKQRTNPRTKQRTKRRTKQRTKRRTKQRTNRRTNRRINRRLAGGASKPQHPRAAKSRQDDFGADTTRTEPRGMTRAAGQGHVNYGSASPLASVERASRVADQGGISFASFLPESIDPEWGRTQWRRYKRGRNVKRGEKLTKRAEDRKKISARTGWRGVPGRANRAIGQARDDRTLREYNEKALLHRGWDEQEAEENASMEQSALIHAEEMQNSERVNPWDDNDFRRRGTVPRVET